MGLVSKSIPNLINGVSQQPPALRLDSQGEVQENGLSDVVDGLKKRPPTKFLNKLVKKTTAQSTDTLTSANTSTLNLAVCYITTYKRSQTEQYTVVIEPDANTPVIYVYDIKGNLNYQSKQSSWDWSSGSCVHVSTNNDSTDYLKNITKEEMASTSVADATFIVNTSKVVDINEEINPQKKGNAGLVFLKSVNYERDYRVEVHSKESTGTLSAFTASGGANTTAGSHATLGDKNLKVSTIINDLRFANSTGKKGFEALAAINPTGTLSTLYGTAVLPQPANGMYGYPTPEWYAITSASPTAAYETVPSLITLRTLTLPTSAGWATTDPTRITVLLGAGSVPYDATGIDGWKFSTNTYASIMLPLSVFSGGFYGVFGYGGGGNVSNWERPTATVKRIPDAATAADVVLAVTPTIEADRNQEIPYFVITSPEGSTFGDFDIIATDDDGGSNLRVFKDTAKSFTDLPNQCVADFRIEVAGDNNKKEDNFYVIFKGGAGSGVWKETMAAGLTHSLDTTTMPHTLKQKTHSSGNLEFCFTKGVDSLDNSWASRKAGDDDTNPFPSFAGKTIKDIFFHRNRLGIISGENVIFSEAGAFFNFFRTTVRGLLDSDPIDVAVSQNEVSELKAALPIQDALLLFSELNQFTLTSSQLLTPAEVTIDQSTKFECDLTAAPVSAGNSAFFATKGGSYAGVREYFTEGDTEIKDATLVTSHVPEYLKGSMRKMVSSTNENMLVCLTTDNHKEAYIYKWYNQGNQRVQSAWSKWIFDTDVVDISFNNSNLYITFGDGRFETMAVRTDSPDVTFGNDVSFPVNQSYSSYPAGSFIDTTVTPNVAKLLPNFLGIANVNGMLAGIIVQGGVIGDGLPFGRVIFTADPSIGAIQTFVVNGTTFSITDSEYVVDAPDLFSSEWEVWRWDFPLTTANVNYFASLIGQTPTFSVGLVSGVTFAGKKHDVLLDHKVRLSHTASTPITSIAQLDAAYPDIDVYTNFINFRGEIVATGNSDAAKNLAITHLYNTSTSAGNNHGENGVSVANYLDVGQPYTFKYGVSQQVFRPVEGDNTTLARFQLRNMTFNFNDTGTFDVVNETIGRIPVSSNFTGRLLGQVSNIVGYAAVVDTGNHTVNIQSQASNAKITISNDTHLPSTFQSAEWEGFVVLRNRRM